VQPLLFGWCEDRGLTLTAIRPFDVGEWVEQLQENHGAAGVKQQLAAVRMMFNWLITGQVAPVNPAAAVRGAKARRQNRQDAGARRERMA
jgi:site-specific recombinase XerD